VFAAFALLGQVGLTVAAGLAVGMLAGWGLDRWLGTRPAFLIAGMVLGLGGGAVSAGRLLLGYLRKRAR
jgi:ATP synthase protein I